MVSLLISVNMDFVKPLSANWMLIEAKENLHMCG